MWARTGSLCNEVWVVARPGWCGVGGEGGGVWAIGSLKILSKHQKNASQVCVVARKRGPGGAGVGGGGGEGAGGCGHALAAFKYSLNIQKMQPGVGSGEAGVVWCGR